MAGQARFELATNKSPSFTYTFPESLGIRAITIPMRAEPFGKIKLTKKMRKFHPLA
jgi:hypothetical protein